MKHLKLFENFTNKFDYEIGKEYEYGELPEETKLDIRVQFSEDDYEEDPTDYVYRFELLQPEDTEEYLMNTFSPYNIEEVLDTPHMKDLMNNIQERGLDYPSVGVEGNHRALIYWYLKKPLPYLKPIKK